MEDVAKNHNMIRVGDRWHYRRRVPQDLLPAFEGKGVIKLSLKTNDVKTARQMRDLEEVKWNAKFHQLRNNGGAAADLQTPLMGPEETRQLKRDLVANELKRFRAEMATGSLPTNAERQEIENDQTIDLQLLRSGDEQTDERLSLAWGQIEKRAQVTNLRPLASEANLAFLMRALVEIANLKVREANLDFSRAFVDPDFKPGAKPELTFGDLVKDYLSSYRQTAKLNERTAKAIDKVEQNIGLMLELVGGHTLLSAIDYDFIENLKLKLSKVPTNYKKIYVGKTLDKAISLAEASGAS